MENELIQGLRDKGLEHYLAKNLQASHALARINSDKIELVEPVLKAMDRAEAAGGGGSPDWRLVEGQAAPRVDAVSDVRAAGGDDG